MIKVYISGTFDLFHIGHVNVLERAKSLGDWLIAGVNTDECLAGYGKRATIPYEQRKQIVSALRCVDEVIPHNDRSEQVPGDIRAIGPDWHSIEPKCANQMITANTETTEGQKLIILPRTPDVSTTAIKAKILERLF